MRVARAGGPQGVGWLGCQRFTRERSRQRQLGLKICRAGMVPGLQPQQGPQLGSELGTQTGWVWAQVQPG